MELVNQTFYFIFGSIVLAISFGAYRQYRLNETTGESFFWLLTLGLMTVSSFSFGLATLYPGFLFVIANTALVFSGLALALLFRSWNRKDGATFYPVTFYVFWIGFVLFLVSFAYFRQSISFEARVIWISGALCAALVWALIELQQLMKRERSFHLEFLKYAIWMQLALRAYRLYEVALADVDAVNLFKESPETAALRIASISMFLLIYIAIGNFQYERLWRKEEKKRAIRKPSCYRV